MTISVLFINDCCILRTSGHAGIRRMLNKVKKYYFWSGIETDVKTYELKCEKCQKQNFSVHTKEQMVVATTAATVFDKVFLDILGPLSKDYYYKNYILTIQCELTKFVEGYPLENKDSISVAKVFIEISY